jgi:serine phosphatase RsbU (regulator of sigma subunit)
VAIGDVVGHDIDAAAAMAQTRNMLRAYAWSYQEPPSLIVSRLDEAVQQMTDVSMATVVFARVEYDSEDQLPRRMRWANAGHPPPLLVTYDGQARFLDAPIDVPIGTGFAGPRQDAAIELPPLATVVFYTDGLIESRARSIDVGLERLRQHAAGLAHRPLDAFCDLLLDRVRPADNDDDVALVALRRPAEAAKEQ